MLTSMETALELNSGTTRLLECSAVSASVPIARFAAPDAAVTRPGIRSACPSNAAASSCSTVPAAVRVTPFGVRSSR
jgi:hypothetical protein